MSPAQPDLVLTRPADPSFEDALRDALRNAPYLGVALLLHAFALLILASLDAPLALDVEGAIIVSETPTVADAPLDPPKPIERPDIEPPETPNVSENLDPLPEPPSPVMSELSEYQSPVVGAEPGALSVIGVGERGPPPGGGGGPGGHDGSSPLKAVRAVENALDWLAAHQHPGGYWSAGAFDEMCGQLGDDSVCDGRGNPAYDVGVTGLALLAFLGAGNTDKRGAHAESVKHGLRFLADAQSAEGLMIADWNTQGSYDQAIASLALCEAYARTRRHYLREPAQRALDALLALRSPGTGWRYTAGHPEMALPGRQADSSVTGWALLAMLTARKAGLPFDELAFEDALAFLDEVTDPETGRTGYTARGERPAREAGLDATWPAEQSESLTAVALLCRVFADPDLQRPGWAELVEKGARLVSALPPLWDDEQPGRRDYYHWYYGTYALYQLGGTAWREWERAVLEAVVRSQHDLGERRGSWDPQVDPWGHQGGRIYSTALMALTLEVYYRYDTILDVR